MGKKQKNCDPDDPDDAKQGDNWDHVALDSEHRLVLSVLPGKRTGENTNKLVQDMKRRTGGTPPRLITSDEYRPYKTAILDAYGIEVTPPRTGKRGRPESSYKVPPPDLNYAVVHKTRENGRVVKIEERVVFGDEANIQAALEQSKSSRKINTAFVERHNGTDRNRNARKVRHTYCFSKDWDIHEAITYFTYYSYNFCWPVRTLRKKDKEGKWQARTAAVVAGLTDHVWSLVEWITHTVVQRE